MDNNKTTVESLAANEYFQQYCLSPTTEHQQYWDNWLIENPSDRATFEVAVQLVQSLNAQISDQEITEEWHRFKQNRDAIQSTQFTIWSWRHIAKIAAAIAIILGAVWGWQSFYHSDPLTAIRTMHGQTQSFALPDGSRVDLNANSRLQFSADLTNKSQREVWLEGEAFFEVAHDTLHPFIVHTQRGAIRVLGTTFNVAQRNEDLEVTLVEGSVQLSLPNAAKINLKPGEQATVLHNTIDLKKADLETEIAWKTGSLVFKNATIQSIITRLEAEYNWTIKVKNKNILQRKVNASVASNNPELLLDALREIYELNIQKISEMEYEIK